jgi:biotin carboxyl carrier protein
LIYDVTIDGRVYRVDLTLVDPKLSTWRCSIDGSLFPIDSVLVRTNELSLLIDGISYDVKRENTQQETHLWVGSAKYQAEVRDPRSLQSQRKAAGDAGGAKKILAPMPGKIVRVLVKEHDSVEAGQGVVVVEAMKMQNELKSPKQGTVQKILVARGASVNAGDLLLIVE